MALFSAEAGTREACWVHVTVTESIAEAGTPIVAASSDPVAAEALPVPGALQNAHADTVVATSARVSARPGTILLTRWPVAGPSVRCGRGTVASGMKRRR